MGHNAEAKLVMGVDFGCPEDGDEAPGWLLKLGDPQPTGGDDYDAPDLYEVASKVDKLLDNLDVLSVEGQVRLHTYGYHDLPRWILGIRVAWAFDWSSVKVHPHEMAERYQEWHTKVREALNRLGAPEDVQIGMYLCPAQ